MTKSTIILEGFWGVGKTSIGKELEKNSYKFILEPDRVKSGISDSEATNWYITEYIKRENDVSKNPIARRVMERSLLSTAGFLYATQRRPNIDALLLNFIKYYKTTKPLVVFLYASRSFIKSAAETIHDRVVQKYLMNNTFINRYDFFYHNVLPFKYGITPLCIDIEDDRKKRKSLSEITRNILLSIENDRIAQINVVCFKNKKAPLFLVLRRNIAKGGFWQTLTGGVKIGQMVDDTIASEIEEELNIKLQKKNLSKTDFTFKFTGNEGYELNEHVFGYEFQSPVQIAISKEHTEYKFLSIKDAVSLVKYKGNKRAITKVYQLIKSG